MPPGGNQHELGPDPTPHPAPTPAGPRAPDHRGDRHPALLDMEVIVRRQGQEHCASITCMIRHYVARRAQVIEDHPHNADERTRHRRTAGRRPRGAAAGDTDFMTRYVIGPDVAVRLAREDAVIRGEHQPLAPALLRSQVLSLLYQAVRRGEMNRKEAERQLEYVRGLRMRLLGDRVLQNVAWKAAGLLGWADTFDAEYVALTQLHADALITLDRQLAHAVKDLVTVEPIEALY
jgi:predicted nucleic acid-binding protein